MKNASFFVAILGACLVLMLGGRPSDLSIETVAYDAVSGAATLKLTNSTPGIVWFRSSRPWTPASGYQREVDGELESLYLLGCLNGVKRMPLLPFQSVTYEAWLPKGVSRPLVFLSSFAEKRIAVVGNEVEIGRYFYPEIDIDRMLFRKHSKNIALKHPLQ